MSKNLQYCVEPDRHPLVPDILLVKSEKTETFFRVRDLPQLVSDNGMIMALWLVFVLYVFIAFKNPYHSLVLVLRGKWEEQIVVECVTICQCARDLCTLFIHSLTAMY